MIIGNAGKILFARLSEGEDLVDSIKQTAQKGGVKSGLILLIGSLKHATLGYYKEGEYKPIPVEGPLEIASCIGNIAEDDKGDTIVHAHLVVSDENGRASGGHMMKNCIVGATAELTIVEATGLGLRRVFDEKTKLKLLTLG